MMRTIQSVLSSAQSFDQFVSDAVQTPKHDWKNFASQWKYNSVCRMLPKHKNQIDSVLTNALDPSKHSLAWAYLLGFKSGEKSLDDPQALGFFLSQVRTLIDKGDPAQIAIAPRPFTDAFRVYANYVRTENMEQFIRVLKRVIPLLQGGNSHILTFAHCELAFCCVQSYCYHLAFPEITRELVQVQGQGSVRAVDNLRYHYYAALIYIGVQQYPKAMEFLTMVLTAPSECLSMIQIEAYKKYVLLSLILKQQMIQLPRYTPNVLKRYYRKFCSEYLEIADAFPKGSEEVSKVVENRAETFMRDHNFGLVKKVMKTLQKHAVRKLTSVYTRLSIEKVAELCNFPSPVVAKKVLVSMIRNNELSATFDAQGVVKFEESVTDSDALMLTKIHGRIKNLLELWNQLDRSQLEVKQSSRYIKKKLNLDRGVHDDVAQQMLVDSMMGGLYRG